YRNDGRNHEEFATGVGLYARWLPSTCNFEEEPTLAALLDRTTKAQRAALEYQDYFSADGLTEQIRIGFSFTEGTVANDRAYARVTPPSPLRLMLSVNSRRDFKIEFDRAYFHSEYVQELASSFQLFLESAAAKKSLPVGELPITTESQRHKVVVDFN